MDRDLANFAKHINSDDNDEVNDFFNYLVYTQKYSRYTCMSIQLDNLTYNDRIFVKIAHSVPTSFECVTGIEGIAASLDRPVYIMIPI